MKKTLLLVSDKRYFFPFIPPNDFFDIEMTYEKQYMEVPRWLRRKRRGLTYYRFGKLGSWKKRIKEYDKIIVFDSSYSKQIDGIIRKNHFENGCFIYYWNKAHAVPAMAKAQQESINSKFKIYSFNKTDCLKYKCFYNTTFYYPVKLENTNKVINDVVFLGAVKGETRVKELDEVCGILNDLKIKLWVHVCGTSEYEPANFKLSASAIDYIDYLRVVQSGRGILDIDAYKEETCSLRAMEALFFDRKYITNNINIKKEKFYNPNNIFVIGSDDLEHLHDFIFSEVVPVSDSIKEEYLIDNWIKRFK